MKKKLVCGKSSLSEGLNRGRMRGFCAELRGGVDDGEDGWPIYGLGPIMREGGAGNERFTAGTGRGDEGSGKMMWRRCNPPPLFYMSPCSRRL